MAKVPNAEEKNAEHFNRLRRVHERYDDRRNGGSIYLITDPLQYGFKKNSSCNHALFTFVESVKYFTKRGSKVHCAFLDASKAFDKVLINGLVCKLIERKLPFHFISILHKRYSNLSCMEYVDRHCIFGLLRGSSGRNVTNPLNELAIIRLKTRKAFHTFLQAAGRASQQACVT